ncbi:MAG: hypothetical protein KDD38_01020 [Bdellovibrionales bacterium]|nr:hypothetical protein [Bdellovibrionales bacterium]
MNTFMKINIKVAIVHFATLLISLSLFASDCVSLISKQHTAPKGFENATIGSFLRAVRALKELPADILDENIGWRLESIEQATRLDDIRPSDLEYLAARYHLPQKYLLDFEITPEWIDRVTWAASSEYIIRSAKIVHARRSYMTLEEATEIVFELQKMKFLAHLIKAPFLNAEMAIGMNIEIDKTWGNALAPAPHRQYLVNTLGLASKYYTKRDFYQFFHISHIETEHHLQDSLQYFLPEFSEDEHFSTDQSNLSDEPLVVKSLKGKSVPVHFSSKDGPRDTFASKSIIEKNYDTKTANQIHNMKTDKPITDPSKDHVDPNPYSIAYFEEHGYDRDVGFPSFIKRRIARAEEIFGLKRRAFLNHFGINSETWHIWISEHDLPYRLEHLAAVAGIISALENHVLPEVERRHRKPRKQKFKAVSIDPNTIEIQSDTLAKIQAAQKELERKRIEASQYVPPKLKDALLQFYIEHEFKNRTAAQRYINEVGSHLDPTEAKTSISDVALYYIETEATTQLQPKTQKLLEAAMGVDLSPFIKRKK